MVEITKRKCNDSVILITQGEMIKIIDSIYDENGDEVDLNVMTDIIFTCYFLNGNDDDYRSVVTKKMSDNLDGVKINQSKNYQYIITLDEKDTNLFEDRLLQFNILIKDNNYHTIYTHSGKIISQKTAIYE